MYMRKSSIYILGVNLMICIFGLPSNIIAQIKSSGYALCIGLNMVSPSHYQGWDGRLQACESDAKDMSNIAKSQGFATTTLLTDRATRKNVFAEIDKAAMTLQPGDIFMLSFSGHGGQIPDINGDEDDNEDETWCLFDSEVLDDELAAMWVKFKKEVRILVISDSCHSGTLTRFTDYSRFRENDVLGNEERNLLNLGFKELITPGSVRSEKTIPSPVRAMPEYVARNTYQKNRAYYDNIGKLTPNQRDSEKNIQATVLLLSACQDNQLAGDGTFNGVFTGKLKTVWADGQFTGNYKDFHKAILLKMPSYQSPEYFIIGLPNLNYESQKPFFR